MLMVWPLTLKVTNSLMAITPINMSHDIHAFSSHSLRASSHSLRAYKRKASSLTWKKDIQFSQQLYCYCCKTFPSHSLRAQSLREQASETTHRCDICTDRRAIRFLGSATARLLAVNNYIPTAICTAPTSSLHQLVRLHRLRPAHN